jgi:hypothetical protein
LTAKAVVAYLGAGGRLAKLSAAGEFCMARSNVTPAHTPTQTEVPAVGPVAEVVTVHSHRIACDGVGGALVVEYPLDFVADVARVEEAEATLRRLEEQREALLQAAEMEVADAYESLEEARGRTEAYDRGRTAAERWLIAMLQGMTLGLHEASDLTDALMAFFQNQLNYLNAVYDLDVAWARLALATGSNLLENIGFSDSPGAATPPPAAP